MADFSRPGAYLDRLRVAERAVKAASFRQDQRLAMREVCEGVLILLEALIAREERGTAEPGRSDQPTAP